MWLAHGVTDSVVYKVASTANNTVHGVANFVDCIKSRELPICDVEIGHRSATVCHLGNIAVRLGRKIQWDPAAEKMIGDEEAAARRRACHRLGSPYFGCP